MMADVTVVMRRWIERSALDAYKDDAVAFI
jgi:hypothetical protein